MATESPAHPLMPRRARLMSHVTLLHLVTSWDSQASMQASRNMRRLPFRAVSTKQEHAVYRIIIKPRPLFESPAPSAARPRSAFKLADAEPQFEGPLTGLTLVGFAVWDTGDQGYRVSFPARRYVDANGRRRSFSLLRSINKQDRTSSKLLQRDIVAAYEAVQQAGTASAHEAAS
jgi:hypothetical protein